MGEILQAVRRAKLTIRDVGLGFPPMFQEQSDCGGWNMEQIELEAKLPPSSTKSCTLWTVVEGDEGQLERWQGGEEGGAVCKIWTTFCGQDRT